jgi:D-arabinose 1-dehydrogenase-like Zn-dependent alcohol dehydrogenase
MSMMKAAVVTDFSKPLEIREVRKPTATDGKIVVKIEACGVCHTDLHAVRADLAESLSFAAEGKVAAHDATDSLDNMNGIFDRMEQGRIDGRIVMTM